MTDDTDFSYFRDIYELYEFFKIPNEWFQIPGAEAVIPVNPSKWSGYIAGSVLSQNPEETSDGIGLLAKPFTNIATTLEYLTDSHNISHFAVRAKNVIVDTAKVNSFSELGGITGSTTSGMYANWAANKYKIQMQVDLERLPSNATKVYNERKKQIRNNGQKKQTATNNVLREVKTPIGSFPSNSTFTEFTRNNSRSIWSRKFFNGGGPRGGAQAFTIEIPTNQTHLYQKQQVFECYDSIDGSTIFVIIFIFVALTKKARYRSRKIRKKLSNLFNKVRSWQKIKFKKKLIANS